MKKKDLQREIAMLLLARVKEENLKKYIQQNIEDIDDDDDEVIGRMIEDGKRGKGLPDIFREDWYRHQGKLFEEYMAEKLGINHTFVRWSNDKNVKGKIYDPTSQQPDLVYHTKDNPEEWFAVECKWHRENKNTVRVAHKGEQIQHYDDFGDKTQCPVFIAIGFGETGKDIDEVYMVPLEVIIEKQQNKTNIRLENIRQYRIQDIENMTYVDGLLK